MGLIVPLAFAVSGIPSIDLVLRMSVGLNSHTFSFLANWTSHDIRGMLGFGVSCNPFPHSGLITLVSVLLMCSCLDEVELPPAGSFEAAAWGGESAFSTSKLTALKAKN